MPQMAPIMWAVVYLFMISIFLITVIKMYYEKHPNLSPSEAFYPLSNKTPLWKW